MIGHAARRTILAAAFGLALLPCGSAAAAPRLGIAFRAALPDPAIRGSAAWRLWFPEGDRVRVELPVGTLPGSAVAASTPRAGLTLRVASERARVLSTASVVNEPCAGAAAGTWSIPHLDHATPCEPVVATLRADGGVSLTFRLPAIWRQRHELTWLELVRSLPVPPAADRTTWLRDLDRRTRARVDARIAARAAVAVAPRRGLVGSTQTISVTGAPPGAATRLVVVNQWARRDPERPGTALATVTAGARGRATLRYRLGVGGYVDAWIGGRELVPGRAVTVVRAATRMVSKLLQPAMVIRLIAPDPDSGRPRIGVRGRAVWPAGFAPPTARIDGYVVCAHAQGFTYLPIARIQLDGKETAHAYATDCDTLLAVTEGTDFEASRWVAVPLS